ncbi:RHS repeat-associated core domain-containing protein, partial [Streptomyces sp. S5]|uniref:RHS repeat-associated core domain-containing protein n=1 Tax=Streptomyces sp. S5 TaxID=1456735 RepID=UPI001F09A1DF
PQGRTTTYRYDANDARITTTYPGDTVQKVTLDNSGRPTTIKATSPKGTLTDLTYSYANVGKDSTKIRTRTDNAAGLKTTYTYDSAGRFSYAAETKGTTQTEAWQYCYDRAGNLTSQGITEGCPRGTTYTYNDAQQLISKNGTTNGWSYDKVGNELAAASTDAAARTGETWSDLSQLTSLTVAGKTYPGQYASTDQSERIALGDTFFHNGPLGLAATSTAGADTGFTREPGGILNSMTAEGKAYYYLTDALGSVIATADETGTKTNTYAYSPRGVTRTTHTTEKIPQPYRFTAGYQDPTGLYHLAARYYDPHIGRFTQPDPSGQEKNPYLYAEGDPVNRIDPSGLSSVAVGAEVCFFLCLGGGYAENVDGSEGGGNFKIGFGSPGASAEAHTSSSNIGSKTDAWFYGGCAAGIAGGELTAGKGGFNASGGPAAATPGCSAGVQVQF